MKYENFFSKYFDTFLNHLVKVDENDLIKSTEMILDCNSKNKKVILVGNGGSASIASHLSIDFTKAAKIRSINFNEASLLTCFANDFGYENWVSEALKFYADEGDVIILISSSGSSQNIIEGAKQAREMGLKVITFTGFSNSNKVKSLGDLNFWVDSSHYNFIEMTHHIWLVSLVDKIVEINNHKKV